MNGLPSMTKPEENVIEHIETEAAFTTTGPIEPDCTLVTVCVPSFEWDSGYAKRKLDVSLTSDQASVLKSMQLGLEKQEARLKNGRYVSNPVDTIRWMLENAK
jgi:hypothetical protein